MVERRFVLDEAKFATQKVVTYVLLFFFASVIANVLFMVATDKSERSTVISTVINLTFLAAGFWLGSSKGAADNREQLNKMLGPQIGATTISAPATITATTTDGHTVTSSTEGESNVAKP